MRHSTIELLSPVGSFEALHTAIQGGADAIYFGVEQLNMRTRSINAFRLEDIATISAISKAHHIRAYITLNTVMYEHDMQLLRSILQEVKTQGIDAVIAADFAVLEYCRQLQIPVHISTQANVSNIESVQFFSAFADVIVLARELTLTQVGSICREIERRDIRGISGHPMRIEIFIHGALCMAVSGKCYLSLHTHNASANRGACTQNCRRPYTVTDRETGAELAIDNEYIMSPKDLCTIDILDQVLNSGATVLKIEGRGKGADYVFTTTTCYREALEAIAANDYTPERIKGWKRELATVYNRGFWEGYYLGRKLGEWTPDPGSVATEKKIYLGKGQRYYPKLGVGEFLVESGTLSAGDTILVTSPAFGMMKLVLPEFRVNGAAARVAQKGDALTFACEHKIGPNDKLYKVVDNA